MALGSKPFTATVALTATAATTVLAVPGATVKRYVKHIKVVNAGAAGTYTLGLKTSSTAPAATDPGIIAFAAPIGANTSVDLFWTGDGLEWVNAGTLNLNGSASAANMSVHIIAQEVLL